MQSVSNEYKEIMNRPIRNRAYVSISLGVINQEAQSGANFGSGYAYWSNVKLPFENKQATETYATLENNFFKADGSMIFVPELDGTEQFVDKVCAVSEGILGSLTVNFDEVYEIKGLTLEFGTPYPTAFSIVTDNGTTSYTNNSPTFETTDVLGVVSFIRIVPTAMSGGNQRLRIHSVKMGVGLNFLNSDVENFTFTETVSSISEELPAVDFSVTIFDPDNLFDIDDDSSFTSFLETEQNVSISVGLEMDDGTVEWQTLGTLELCEWNSLKGNMRFIAKDRISFLDDVSYTAGNKIYTRTLYAEAESVLKDAGLDADEYSIDECLKDITITNPMPEISHAECLQLIANAGRCIFYQDRQGVVRLEANFANVLEPDNLVITANSAAAWSNLDNVSKGSTIFYADMTQNFFKADGKMYFLPENGNYLDTVYVSSQVASSSGTFTSNPTLTVTLPAGFTYYSVYIDFAGNNPTDMIVHTFYNGVAVENITYSNLKSENLLEHEFRTFDQMTFEFTKASPNNRVLVNKVSFGDLSDYYLTKDNMLDDPIGYKERKTKNVSVRICTFSNDSSGKPVQVDDNVYYTTTINPVGMSVQFENSLISTESHAKMVAEWLGNYYANIVSYTVDYRGDPRLNASDFIYMESNVLNNLQVDIESHTLTFNGAFGGKLELRRAINLMGE